MPSQPIILYRLEKVEKTVDQLKQSGAGADHERRIVELERYKPAVMADRMQTLSDDVKSLKRAFYTFAFGVVGSAIVFAFTVFALLGKG